MLRVPTYSSYINLVNRTMETKALFNLYNFQTVTGLKSDKYSGYGINAYDILTLENTLKINNNFLENNSRIETNIEAMSTALTGVTTFIGDVKTQLSALSGTALSTITPDYTGGKIIFNDDNFANYVGSTITVSGTQYTFTNGPGGATDIDISGAADTDAIMAALQSTLPSNPDFEFLNNTFTFPLYTIDGESSVLSLSGVETAPPHIMNSDESAMIKNLQQSAFASMQILFDALNSNIGGQYLFGGGVNNNPPTSFPFKTLEEFQNYYDGLNISFPSTPSANLSNISFNPSDTGNISLELDAGDTNTGTITASTGDWTKLTVSSNPTTTGNLSFDSVKNTIKASNVGAFASLKAGDSIVMSGGGSGGNDKAYIIQSISADGKTITVDSTTPITTTTTVIPNDDVLISKSFPIGSVVDMNNLGSNISKNVQIIGISDDGKTLNVKVDPNYFPPNGSPTVLTPADNWGIENQSYYNGGNLSSEKRISENQTIVFDITAQDPAFEKLFRALGTIAQGNLVDTRDPTTDNLIPPIDINRTKNIIENSLQSVIDISNSSSRNHNVKNGDIETIIAKISNNFTTLNRCMDIQNLTKVDLQNSIYNLKNVNEEEAALNAIVTLNSLNASYSILQQALQTSLLNYINF